MTGVPARAIAHGKWPALLPAPYSDRMNRSAAHMPVAVVALIGSRARVEAVEFARAVSVPFRRPWRGGVIDHRRRLVDDGRRWRRRDIHRSRIVTRARRGAA